MKQLTDQQRRVVDFIAGYRDRYGVPPTVREIAAGLGCRSPNNVRQHLRLIEQKGHIRRLPGKARGIEVLTVRERQTDSATRSVPLVGAIAAGAPITAAENIEGMVALDRDLFRGGDLFSLRVKGDSMRDAGILDGDIAVIRSQPTVEDGQVAAVIIEGEATLKRVIRHEGQIVLRAANPAYPDLPLASDRDTQIAGKLQGVIRTC